MLFTKLAATLSLASLAAAELQYFGVNEAGMEFGETKLPGLYGKDFIDPDVKTIPYWRDQGLNIFRYSFKWERAQPEAGGPLNETYIGYMDKFIETATSAENGHIKVLLDPHNYARYYGKVIGVDESIGTLVGFWVQLALRYKDNEHVFFDLMNEPHTMDAQIWWTAAQASIDAIRAVGAKNLVLVPGISWTGAHSWISSTNAQYAANFRDDGNNFAFDMHQYLDSDYSGTSEICSKTPAQALTSTTDWLREHNMKAFLGEFAASTDASCDGAIEAAGRYLNDNNDVWLGAAWWAAGPWWGNYMYSAEPVKGTQTQPQMYIWQAFFPGNDAVDGPGIPEGTITPPAPSPTQTRPVPTETPTDIPIYIGKEQIEGAWENWSWDTEITYNDEPSPANGDHNLVATSKAYGGFSVKGPKFTYAYSLVFYASASGTPQYTVQIDSYSENYSSDAFELSKVCGGTISDEYFVHCEVLLEPLGFHAWDRITIQNKASSESTLVLSDIRILGAPGGNPGGNPTTTTPGTGHTTCADATATETTTETVTERETITADPITITAAPITITETRTVTSTGNNNNNNNNNCAAQYAQCGGRGWTGATCCRSGLTCRTLNDYYFQCL